MKKQNSRVAKRCLEEDSGRVFSTWGPLSEKIQIVENAAATSAGGDGSTAEAVRPPDPGSTAEAVRPPDPGATAEAVRPPLLTGVATVVPIPANAAPSSPTRDTNAVPAPSQVQVDDTKKNFVALQVSMTEEYWVYVKERGLFFWHWGQIGVITMSMSVLETSDPATAFLCTVAVVSVLMVRLHSLYYDNLGWLPSFVVLGLALLLLCAMRAFNAKIEVPLVFHLF
jgi:hypothetical protein